MRNAIFHRPVERTNHLRPMYREFRHGPELDLVCNYVLHNLPIAPAGQLRSIFLEPRIESGFPDIVVAYWQVDIVERWDSERAMLTTPDIRIVHFLSTQGPCSRDDLVILFGSRLCECLERLHAAKLVSNSRQFWKAKPLNQIFAIRRLIAIEAKIGAWRKGLQQAIQNSWFASESYLLLINRPREPELIDRARKLGIGLATNDVPLSKSLVAARKERIPSSYASWLFNEWAWHSVFE
jgi:hypothetical protein